MMNHLSEKQLEKYLELLNEVPISTSINESTKRAYNQLKQKRLKQKRLKSTILAVAILFLAFCGTIRYSPTVANAVAQLPGMKPFVDMIIFDKGMEDILSNNYFEEINISQTIDGNTLTVTGVVADESGMIISYKYQSEEDLSIVSGIHTDVKQGQELIEATVGSSWYALEENTFEIENTVEVTASDGIDYSTRQFELIFSLRERPDMVFTIPFTLENEIKQSKHLMINQQLEVDGQRFSVHEIILSPLRTELKMSIDPTNSMKILSFVDIRVYDENQEEWGKIKNGASGFGTLEDVHFSIMLESNYFRTPKKLTIEFKEIEAISKKDAYIEIDWTDKKIIHQPKTLDLELQINDAYEITYKLANYTKNEHKAVFYKMIDAEGTVFYSNSTWISSLGDYQQIGQLFDVQNPPVNPIKLEVARYESYLQGTASIEVQLD